MKCSHQRVIVPAVLLLLAGGCGSSGSSALTGPSPTLSTETFTGSIGQGGIAVHNFTVNSSGYTLLAGFTSIAPASVTALGLGIGAWDATTSTCGLNLTQNDTARAGSTALTGTAAAGAFCLRVYDAGNVPADVTASYTVQVQDANTHQPVNAAVLVNGAQVAQSNVAFNYTFVMRTVRVFDPETRRWFNQQVPPTMAVTAPGYTAVNVDLGVAAADSAAA